MIGLLKDLDRWLNPYYFTGKQLEDMSALRVAKKIRAGQRIALEEAGLYKPVEESGLYLEMFKTMNTDLKGVNNV